MRLQAFGVWRFNSQEQVHSLAHGIAYSMQHDHKHPSPSRHFIYAIAGDFEHIFDDANQAVAAEPGSDAGYLARSEYYLMAGHLADAQADADQTPRFNPRKLGRRRCL